MPTVRTDLGTLRESARRERVEKVGGIAATNVQKELETLDGAVSTLNNEVATLNSEVAAVAGAPGGRLTLSSGNPVSNSSIAGATTLYYSPAFNGGYVPIYNGSLFAAIKFPEVSQTTTDTTKSPAACIANANYDIFAWMDGATPRISRGDYWKTGSLACTISIASPGVVTCAGASFNTNFNPPVVFSTTGALPTGLTAGTTYYLLPLTATTAQISATPGGSAINTSGSQSGSHTLVMGDDTGAAYRSGTTSLTTVNALLLNTNAITNGPGALRGTYLGTVRTDAAATLNMTYGSTSPGGGPALLHVYNQYNQVPVLAKVGDNSTQWTYATAAWRMMNNSAGNRVSFLCGTPSAHIEVNRGAFCQLPGTLGAFAFAGFILDATAGEDFLTQFFAQATNSPSFYQNVHGAYTPQTGAHFIQATEYGGTGDAFAGSVQSEYLLVETWQ